MSSLPEGLEELDKLNEAHGAVRDHEVLEALEAAFPSAVPTLAAPRSAHQLLIDFIEFIKSIQQSGKCGSVSRKKTKQINKLHKNACAIHMSVGPSLNTRLPW